MVETTEQFAEQDSDGGYEYTFVHSVPDRLMCMICYLPCRNAQLSKCCGYVYCESCLIRWEKTPGLRYTCPTCRVDRLYTLKHREANRTMKELEVICPNGCGWQGRLGSVNKHLNDLQCKAVEQSSKHVTMMRNNSILFAILCYTKVCYNALRKLQFPAIEHAFLIVCMAAAFFIGTVINLELIVCGSNNRTLSAMPSRPSPPSSFNIMMENVCAPLLQNFTKPIIVEMLNFTEKMTNKEQWHSNPFFVFKEGYQMCLRVDAAGFGDGEGTHMSLMLYLMKGPHDDNLEQSGLLPVDGDFKIELLDQSSGEDHYIDYMYMDVYSCSECAHRVLGDDDMAKGLESTQYISHDFLCQYTDYYLINDTLYFRISYRVTEWIFVFIVIVMPVSIIGGLVLDLCICCFLCWYELPQDERSKVKEILVLLPLIVFGYGVAFFALFTVASVVVWAVLTILITTAVYVAAMKDKDNWLNIKRIATTLLLTAIILLVLFKIIFPAPLAWPWI